MSSTDSSEPRSRVGTERYVLVRGPLDSDIRIGFNDAVTPLVEMQFQQTVRFHRGVQFSCIFVMFLQFTTLLTPSSAFELVDCLFAMFGGSGLINRQAKFSPWLVAFHCFYISVNLPLAIVYREGVRASFMGSFIIIYTLAFATRHVDVTMVGDDDDVPV